MNNRSIKSSYLWKRGAASFPPPLAGLLVALSVLSAQTIVTAVPPQEFYVDFTRAVTHAPWFGDVPAKALSAASAIAEPTSIFKEVVTRGSLETYDSLDTTLDLVKERNQMAAASLANHFSDRTEELSTAVGESVEESATVLSYVPDSVAETLVAAVTTTVEEVSVPATSWWDRVGESLSLWSASLINGWANLGTIFGEYRDLVVSNWRQFLKGQEPLSFAKGPTDEEIALEQTKDEIRQQVEASIRQDLERTLQEIGSSRGNAASYDPGQTITVFPSTGSSTLDASLTTKVKNSFSDDVTVQFDETGRSGVITPEFRSTTGSNYLFILTPLRK